MLTPSKFDKYAGKFLYSPSGSKHRAYFKVDGNFSCGESLPPVKVCNSIKIIIPYYILIVSVADSGNAIQIQKV